MSYNFFCHIICKFYAKNPEIFGILKWMKNVHSFVSILSLVLICSREFVECLGLGGEVLTYNGYVQLVQIAFPTCDGAEKQTILWTLETEVHSPHHVCYHFSVSYTL